MAVIKVLRHFTFTFPPIAGDRTPTEQKFVPGDVELPDDHALFRHVWFIKDHCDGCVESAEQAVKRLADEKAKLDEQERQNILSKAAAEAAIARMAVKTEAPATIASKEEVEKELNTPVNVLKLRGKGGPGSAMNNP